MNFIKRVLATVVGIFVFLFICFFFVAVIGYAFSSSGKSDVKVSANSILQLKLDYQLMDYSGDVTIEGMSFMDEGDKDGLFDLVNAIDYAATDDDIKGVSIELAMEGAGITQLKTLREALIRFKESGKFITAYADYYSQSDYYLSSVADNIYLNPAGDLDFRGLSAELLYMKDIQEKSGVKMEVIRLGKYKSAVEPFLDSEMSDENREQISSYLNSIWGNLRDEIADSRGIQAEELDHIAGNLLARSPEKAKEVGLVDDLIYLSDYEKILKETLALGEKDKIKRISIEEYAGKIGNQNAYAYNKDKIAVIYAQGEIVYGEGSPKRVGPAEVNQAIENAKNDKNVKAIVVRVNSPGGSALSSELIWKELEDAKKVKPVVVSMGDMAASGGYYIAAGADRIFAEPTTITGSIGVFGTLPNLKGLADNVGIKAHQVSTHDHAVAYSLFQEMTDDQRGFIQESVAQVYDIFKARVSEGRNMSLDAVEKIAQGRVWTGEQALENGLVDELGGLDAALAYAAEMADIETFQIREYPKYNIDIKKLMKRFGLAQSSEDLIKETIGEDLYRLFDEVQAHTQRQGVQMILPYSIEIK